MNDYFDQLETGLGDAVRRRAHLPWYLRIAQLSAAHRGIAALAAAFVIATPSVAAVGSVAGWFGKGSSPIYHPASATSGLGKVLPRGGQLLPIRVADPDGGPPWGIRLVKTNRGETCIQVGRVVDGQIGQLGIDGAWHDDHKFHEIKPNDQLADICGATDAAGNGFVDQAVYGAPASVDIPLDNSSIAPNACVDPYLSLSPSAFFGRRGKLPTRLKRVLRYFEEQRRKDGDCPRHAMRMIFVGLLGPDARTVTYRTPGGQTRTQQTEPGTGAYLVIFRETARDCLDFTRSLIVSPSGGCGPRNTMGAAPYLRGPSAITGVTYANGRSCTDQVSGAFARAYRKVGQVTSKLSGKRAEQVFDRFLAQHHLDHRTWLDAVMPRCLPVGWVSPKLPGLTSADVASPIKVTLIDAKRFCVPKSQVGFDGAIACDLRVPKGDRWFYGTIPVRKTILLKISFVARQPVTTDNSSYSGAIKNPGNNGGGDLGTDENIRAGQRITLSTFLGVNLKGTYRGIMTFVQNSGQNGQRGLGAYVLLSRGRGASSPKGVLVVGRFSFKLPLKR
jgi:hypothetical protein